MISRKPRRQRKSTTSRRRRVANRPRPQLNNSRGRRLRYQVAVSLDGFIATPDGGYDWIVSDPDVDFAALYKEFDTAVMGRKTYDLAASLPGHGAMPGIDVIAFSRTMKPETYPGVRVVNDDPRQVVADLKKKRAATSGSLAAVSCFDISSTQISSIPSR